MTDIAKRLAAELEAALLAAITGPPRKQRQTALRLRGRCFETVELDDAGNVRHKATDLSPRETNVLLHLTETLAAQAEVWYTSELSLAVEPFR